MSDLKLRDAQRVVDAAIAEGERRGVTMAAAVVGSDGELFMVARRDGSRDYFADLAYGKAIASAICDEPSSVAAGPTPENPQRRPGVSGVQLRASELYGNRPCWAPGAVPLRQNGTCVGAIGVASLDVEMDEEIAAVAAKAL